MGEDLVGVQPEAVQDIFLDEVLHFLEQVQASEGVKASSHGIRDRIIGTALTRTPSISSGSAANPRIKGRHHKVYCDADENDQCSNDYDDALNNGVIPLVDRFEA